MMLLLTIFIAAIYGYFICWLLLGLHKLRKKSRQSAPQQHNYSLIIAAHNEATQIADCLQALANQNYPAEKFEVILAADRCTDETVAIAEKFHDQFSRLHIIEIKDVPPGVSPKKNALDLAIQAANFDHFIFLDADVITPANHLRAMDESFRQNTAAVVSLMKFDPPQNFWQRFIVFEKLISWCISGAGVGYNAPIISYGGNWGYTRKVFTESGGFAEIRESLSGDDDLMLQRFGKLGARIDFCLNPAGWVRTPHLNSFSHFLRQRRRHFSAGQRYSTRLQVGYFFFHLSNLLLWIMPLIYTPALFFLLLKLLADYLVTRRGQTIFQERTSLLNFILFDGLYMLYNTLIGPLGHIGKIKW